MVKHGKYNATLHSAIIILSFIKAEIQKTGKDRYEVSA